MSGNSDIWNRVFEADPTGWHANVISILDVCTLPYADHRLTCIDSPISSVPSQLG